ncbi:MAG: hypothetical protein Q8R00_00075 [Candidatus Nanoarchaeia archaeon]|nr:hypothetical protein [Candidatus Nanoarchaeia archaeon]
MPPEGTVQDISIKPDLIDLRNSFFESYNKRLSLIKKITVVLKTTPKKLRIFESRLEKNLKAASARYPVVLEPREIRERTDKFAAIIDEFRDYLNGVLAPNIASFDVQILIPLKKAIPALELLINKIKNQMREKLMITSFSKSELSSISDLLKIVKDSVESFEENQKELLIEIAKIMQFRAISEKEVRSGKLTKEELFKKYNLFIKETEKTIFELSAKLDNITLQLNVLDNQIIKIARGLP